MQPNIPQRLHMGHQGITKCHENARHSVWWLGLSKQLETLVSNCHVCCQFRSQPTEPLIATPFPQLPWQKVGVDLFTWEGAKYLLLIDYYSRYIEVTKLPSETSNDVIERMKSMFARRGIPQEVRSDNGPQFLSALFRKFSTEYNLLMSLAAQGVLLVMVKYKELLEQLKVS